MTGVWGTVRCVADAMAQERAKRKAVLGRGAVKVDIIA